jgi:inorganic phosphate transporter, PiT family
MLFMIFLSSGLFLGWSLGANDAANIFGSAVGSRMISFIKAAWVASIFVVLGAVFQGKGGSETLNELGSVDALAGAFTVSLCSALVVFTMTRRSLPVSTSQAIVGAIVGWSTFTGNPTDFKVLGKIVTTWITGPILGMIFAALLFLLLRKILRRAKIHVIRLDSYIRTALLLIGAFGAYSLGANNIANVMGVFVNSAPKISLDFGIFELDGVQVLFLVGGLAIATGIFTYSKKVMEKVGAGILSLTPEAAIVVVLSQSLVLFLFSSRGLADFMVSLGLPPLPMVPVSSTQLVIGALIGIGLVKGLREIKFSALGGIALGWVTTPLLSGILTWFSLFFVQNLFGLQVSSGANKTSETDSSDIPEEIIVDQVNMIIPGVLFTAVAVIIILGWLYLRQQRITAKKEKEILSKQNELFQAEKTMKELELNSMQAHNTSLSNKLEQKSKKYTEILLNINEQRDFLEHINSEMEELIGTTDIKKRDEKLQHLSALLKQRMHFNREINEFYGQIEELYKGFTQALSEKFPTLTQNDLRMAILIKLNLSSKEMATLMNLSIQNMELSLNRLRNKLNISEQDNITDFIKNAVKDNHSSNNEKDSEAYNNFF